MNTTKIAVTLFSVAAVSLFTANFHLRSVSLLNNQPGINKKTAHNNIPYIPAPRIADAGTDQDNTRQDFLKRERGIITFQNIPARGIVFRIQVLSSKCPVSIFSSTLAGIGDVREYYYNGLYKYTVGEFKLPKQSNRMFEDLELKGYHDTFMVAFKDDKPMKVVDAMKAVMKM